MIQGVKVGRRRGIGRAGLWLPLVVALSGCGEDEAIDTQEDTSRPPVSSPFVAVRDPDTSTQRPGLKAQVEIITDGFGVPHVYGKHQADVVFANGYLHARDRLFLMDAFRMLGQGRITEYLGDVGMAFDPMFRATFMTAEGEQVADAVARQLPAPTVALLEAYAAGVNAYLAELRRGEHELPPSYRTPLLAALKAEDIEDWQPRDTIAVARVMEWQLTDGGGDFDQYIGGLIQQLPAEVFADVVRFQPGDPTVILPDWFSGQRRQGSAVDLLGLNPKDKEHRAAFDGARRLMSGLSLSQVPRRDSALFGGGLERTQLGSNNWVIAGEHTQSGFPLVANDPHLGFVQPAQFHHAHIDTRLYGGGSASASSAIGVSVPGISGIVIGHNERVAWGATVVGWDVSDLYVETLNEAGDAVLFKGEYVPILRYEQTFKLGKGADARVEKLVVEYVPHHGPIIDGSRRNGKALSAKWTGRLIDNEVDGVLGLLTAKDIDGWMKSLEHMSVLAQSWNGADVDGNIGYFPHARIPLRSSVTGDCAPYKPMDGTGPCEWTGFIAAPDIPQSKNPSRGWVVTANNDVAGNLQDNDPTNDPQYLVAERAVGFRAGRITQLIEEQIERGEKFTMEDMERIQADTLSLEAGRLRAHLLAAAAAEPDLVVSLGLQQELERLTAWGLTTPSGVAAAYRTDGGPTPQEIEESIATSIFYAWLPRFQNRVLSDELAAHGASVGSADKARALLWLLDSPDQTATGQALFDDLATPEVETKEQQMLNALSDASAYLASPGGFNSSDQSTWRWGELHGVELRDLFGLFSGTAFITRGPYPRGGSNHTVDVAAFGSSATRFIANSGPQMRFVAELRPDGIVSRNALPGGQSDKVDSPHYEDLLQLWLRNESFPYYFQPADVAGQMERYELFHP